MERERPISLRKVEVSGTKGVGLGTRGGRVVVDDGVVWEDWFEGVGFAAAASVLAEREGKDRTLQEAQMKGERDERRRLLDARREVGWRRAMVSASSFSWLRCLQGCRGP